MPVCLPVQCLQIPVITENYAAMDVFAHGAIVRMGPLDETGTVQYFMVRNGIHFEVLRVHMPRSGMEWTRAMAKRMLDGRGH